MQHDVIETAAGWRLGLAVVGLFLLAGVAVNVVRMVRGDWQWNGRGSTLAASLLLLAVLAVVGNAFVWTTRAYVDASTRQLHFSTLGREEVRDLGVGTTVRLKRIGAVPTVRAFERWEYVVSAPDEAPLTISTPWLGSARRLAEQLGPMVEANPDLPADDATRDWLADPTSIGGS